MEYLYFKAYSFNNEIRLSQKNICVCRITCTESEVNLVSFSISLHLIIADLARLLGPQIILLRPPLLWIKGTCHSAWFFSH